MYSLTSRRIPGICDAGNASFEDLVAISEAILPIRAHVCVVAERGSYHLNNSVLERMIHTKYLESNDENVKERARRALEPLCYAQTTDSFEQASEYYARLRRQAQDLEQYAQLCRISYASTPSSRSLH
jgi:hypothetical protein